MIQSNSFVVTFNPSQYVCRRINVITASFHIHPFFFVLCMLYEEYMPKFCLQWTNVISNTQMCMSCDIPLSVAVHEANWPCNDSSRVSYFLLQFVFVYCSSHLLRFDFVQPITSAFVNHSSTVQGRSLLPTSVQVKYAMLSATRLEPLRSSSRPLFMRGRTTERAMALSSSMRFSKRRRFSRL